MKTSTLIKAFYTTGDINKWRGVTFEFPWFGLNTSDMRKKGKKALLALVHAVIKTSKLQNEYIHHP